MDILWEPEHGKCGLCRKRRHIRRYSSDGRVLSFCFPCWDANQVPRVMSSAEWEDDERVLFAFPSEERPSRAA